MLREYHRTGDRSTRDAAIGQYLPLARVLARRYWRGGEPLEDLEQVACLALVRAVDAFDPSRTTAFSSYAVPCITGELKHHFRDNGWAVRPPRDLQELALRVTDATDALATETGGSPRPAQVAERCGVSVEEVLAAREAYRSLHPESLDRKRSGADGEERSLHETLPDHDSELPRVFERVALDGLLATLQERERVIIRLYYREELTQSEIGRRLGFSQMHVSRMLRDAAEQLTLRAAA